MIIIFRNKYVPSRKCIVCGKVTKKENLIRIAKTKNQKFFCDFDNLSEGRGAYICNNEECVDMLVKKKPLSRAFRENVSLQNHEKIREELLNWKKISV